MSGMPLPFTTGFFGVARTPRPAFGATGFFEDVMLDFFGSFACAFLEGCTLTLFFLGVGAATFLDGAFFTGTTFFLETFTGGFFFCEESFALEAALTLDATFLETTGFFFAVFTTTFFTDEVLPETGGFAAGLAVAFFMFCFLFDDI